jgi:hypothetical protein
MNVASGYIRKNHEVEAVQVTYEWFKEIAEWCGGFIRTSTNVDRGELYIRVPIVRRSQERGRPNRAYVGDWILKDGDGFKIYSNEAFTNVYSPVTPDPKKYQAILRLVRFAMTQQDAAARNGKSSADTKDIAEQIARKIMEIT